MNLIYVANARMPTEKAHGYQIAKICESLAGLGTSVELWVPTRRNRISGDVFSYYGVKRNFAVRYFSSPDVIGLSRFFGPLGFYLQSLLFLLRLSFAHPPKSAWVMTRNPELAWLFSRKGYRVAFYAHYWPEHGASIYRHLLRRAALVICNSKGTADAFSRQGFGDTVVVPNGVDLADFDVPGTKDNLRKELGLPGGKIALYAGHLYAWKGIDVVFDAASRMEDVTFVLVGGTEADVSARSEEIKRRNLRNVILTGHKPRTLMPKYLKAADVLLLPNAPVSEESRRYTSPIKLFEYLAAGAPILASDLPSIREVLSEDTACLVEAGNPDALTQGVRAIFADPIRASRLSQEGHAIAARSTWTARAQSILSALSR